MAIEILLRVTRGAGDRLDGSAQLASGSEVREFSGMLELMRVFEDLIPADGSDGERRHGQPPSPLGRV